MAAKKKMKEKAISVLSVKEMVHFHSHNNVGLKEDVVEEMLQLIGETQRAELEKRWKEIKLLELQLNLKKSQLLQSQIQFVLHSYNH
ncbi:mediator-associated protein 1 [Melia azedarach]|uniref:Mediator-associated protein 1 n=1 Tax=Melia azedarach TaxID=155640 RepID=A0ACC1Y7Q8_MELAZ|nr:mediator-associated protein 1 [Melia azedarach]